MTTLNVAIFEQINAKNNINITDFLGQNRLDMDNIGHFSTPKTKLSLFTLQPIINVCKIMS